MSDHIPPVFPAPTVVEFILDETGSMSPHKAATLQAFNAFLAEQRNGPGDLLFTLTKFSSAAGIRTPYQDLAVGMVPEITASTFWPSGGTNLYDTIAVRIDALTSRLASWPVRPNIMVVAMTDGEDNASMTSEPVLAAKIGEASQRGWACLFLGATPRAIEIAKRLGFTPGNTKRFEMTEVADTMATLSRATTVFRTRAATGECGRTPEGGFGHGGCGEILATVAKFG